MAAYEKLFRRLASKPSDFTWSELRSLMTSLSYELKSNGGSSRKFIHPDTRATLFMHEPHPSRVLKAYQVREAIRFLKQEGHLK